MAKFKGYSCKTSRCLGHKAGYDYAKNGGSRPSDHSNSFNQGMEAARKAPKKKKRK